VPQTINDWVRQREVKELSKINEIITLASAFLPRRSSSA